MARQVQIAGRTTGLPQVSQNSIRKEGGNTPPALANGVVCIIGTCEGELQPLIPYKFGSTQRLKELLGKGDLYDAARFAFKPSRDDELEVRGASEVLAVRVNPATQGTYDFEDGSSNDLINITSRGYGIKAAGITLKLIAGTNGGLGKKITVSQFGETDEVKDNLGYQPIFVVRYTGDGTTATMSISRTTLSTTLAGDQTDGSVNLSVAFSTYDTIEKLVTYINAQTGYEAVSVVAGAATYKCENLDFVTNADIHLVRNGTVSLAATTTTSMTLAAVTADNAVRLDNSEFVFLSSVGAPNTVIRGYMDTSPAIHSGVDADEFYACSGTNQAIIDWANTYSQRISAARDTAYAVGRPANVSTAVYLTGAGEGSAGNTDWQNALKAIRQERVNFIVLTSTDATHHGYLGTHMNSRWSTWGMEALAHVGAAKDETLSQLKTRAKALNNKNTAIWFQDVQRDDDTGTDTNYAPWACAAMAAGIQAGTAFGEALTYKSFDLTSVDQNSAIDMIDDAETFVEYGLSFIRYEDGEWRCTRCLSTWTSNDNHHEIEMNVRNSLAWTVYKVRYIVKFKHFGKRARKGNATAIKSTARTTLEEIRDKDEAIVDGSRIVNGVKQDIPAFDDLDLTQTGNVARLSYQCVPIGATDFIPVDTVVGEFQDAA